MILPPPIPLIRERLRRWQAGEFAQLWEEAVEARAVSITSQQKEKKTKSKGKKTQQQHNSERASALAQDGEYSRALAALSSLGIAEQDQTTLAWMKQKHPPYRQKHPPYRDTIIPNTDCPRRTFSPLEV